MTGIKSVDPTTLHTWINNKEALVIDVREPIEYQIAHIAETINVPLSQLEDNLEDNLYFINMMRGKKIVMVCRAGIRSMVACLRLQQLDDTFDSWNFTGGINQWHAERLPLIRIE